MQERYQVVLKHLGIGQLIGQPLLVVNQVAHCLRNSLLHILFEREKFSQYVIHTIMDDLSNIYCQLIVAQWPLYLCHYRYPVQIK